MKIKVMVFDLDDTLYNEIDYVYSGFNAVSNYFCTLHQINQEKFYQKMILLLKNNGRGSVFDDILKIYNIYSKANVKKAISLYRLHIPQIRLSDNVIELLKYYNNHIPLYIVTDGNKIVQANKLDALNLKNYIKKSFITHRYGKNHSKPSTYCFEQIAKIEKVKFSDIVYIGDNINKDFVNIKKLGFRTIRVLNGMFKDLDKPLNFHAEIDVQDLTSIKKIIKV